MENQFKISPETLTDSEQIGLLQSLEKGDFRAGFRLRPIAFLDSVTVKFCGFSMEIFIQSQINQSYWIELNNIIGKCSNNGQFVRIVDNINNKFQEFLEQIPYPSNLFLIDCSNIDFEKFGFSNVVGVRSDLSLIVPLIFEENPKLTHNPNKVILPENFIRRISLNFPVFVRLTFFEKFHTEVIEIFSKNQYNKDRINFKIDGIIFPKSFLDYIRSRNYGISDNLLQGLLDLVKLFPDNCVILFEDVNLLKDIQFIHLLYDFFNQNLQNKRIQFRIKGNYYSQFDLVYREELKKE